MGDQNPEVLIVGAGPVGQFAALALARRGVRVRIVDRGVWPCAQSYALALHPQSLALMREAGLLSTVLEDASVVRSLALYEGVQRKGHIRLDRDDDPAACVAVVRQDALESLLEVALDDAGVHIEWRHEVPRLTQSAEHVEATVDKFDKESRGYIVAHTEWVIAKSMQVEAPFVIGADGYNSKVRRMARIGFPEVAPAQYFAIFEFKTDADLGGQAHLVLGAGTVDVLWPLHDGSCRWSFQLPDYRAPEAEAAGKRLKASGFELPSERTKERFPGPSQMKFDELDEAVLRRLVAERAPWFGGSIGNLVWRSVVRFERRLATSFGVGRLWLAGDAAHLTGPIGVQSMNSGLQEADDLAAVLTGILRKGHSLDRLEDYNRRWMVTWRQLHSLDGALQLRGDADTWVASHALDLMACLPGHGKALGAMADQLGLMLPETGCRDQQSKKDNGFTAPQPRKRRRDFSQHRSDRSVPRRRDAAEDIQEQ
jgi:NADPH-dependent dioxygenase